MRLRAESRLALPKGMGFWFSPSVRTKGYGFGVSSPGWEFPIGNVTGAKAMPLCLLSSVLKSSHTVFRRNGSVPKSERAQFLIDDAWSLHRDALVMVQEGRLRNAAEKAWGATKRATDALILERNGREPGTTCITYRSIRGLRHQSAELESLANRYSQRMQDLHWSCFYDGVLAPEEPIIRDIEATADYIRDSERLASG